MQCRSSKRRRPTRLGAHLHGCRSRPQRLRPLHDPGANGHKPAGQSSGPGWIYDPGYNSAEACQPHIFDIFDEIEQWLADETNYKAVDILRKYEVPCTILAELGYDMQTVARMRAAGVVG
jgi:hypothetical protein